MVEFFQSAVGCQELSAPLPFLSLRSNPLELWMCLMFGPDAGGSARKSASPHHSVATLQPLGGISLVLIIRLKQVARRRFSSYILSVTFSRSFDETLFSLLCIADLCNDDRFSACIRANARAHAYAKDCLYSRRTFVRWHWRQNARQHGDRGGW